MQIAHRRGSLSAVALLVGLSACGGQATPAQQDPEQAQGATVSCSYPVGGGAVKPVDPPSEKAPSTGTAHVTLTIDGAEVNITMDRAAAPCTVNSFESLAKQGWFDKTRCHRLTTQGIFVLQCGDPSATGAGGPGYSFADELTAAKKLEPVGSGGRAVNYKQGTVAMANSGADTNGSQFFLVWGDSPLEPNYTVFGQMDAEGLKAVGNIGGQGTSSGAPDGPAKVPAMIESVTLG